MVMYSSGPFEGYANYKAIKNNATATNALSITYAPDKSRLFDVSYGLAISGYSVSITPNKPDKVDFMSRNMGVTVN